MIQFFNIKCIFKSLVQSKGTIVDRGKAKIPAGQSQKVIFK